MGTGDRALLGYSKQVSFFDEVESVMPTIISRVVKAVAVCCAVASGPAAQHAREDVEYLFPNEQPVIELTGWRTQCGDSSAWCRPNYDDTGWEPGIGAGLWVSEGKPGRGVRWYRKTIFFPEPLDTVVPLALYQVAVVSASEIYWDGILIGQSGRVGKSRASESTGYSAQVYPIPCSLASIGRHVLALRASNHHGFSGIVEAPLRLGYLSAIHRALFGAQALSLFLAGIFFVTALFHFAILLGRGNQWPYALFSAFCLSCAVHIIITSMLRYLQINLASYYLLAAVNDIPWLSMMILLPVFFLFEFESPFRRRLTVTVSVVALLVVVFSRLVTFGAVPASWLPFFTTANILHAYATIFLSIGVSIWAVIHRRAGSLTAVLGLIAFLLGVYVTSRLRVEHGWAIGFAILNGFLAVSLSRQMSQRSRMAHEAQVRSVRLEAELLKRHIQPHFLLNTLNSIVAWLEEEPTTAARLVTALADEFRMLLSCTRKELIPLADEIDLCRAHLQVMSLRQDKQFEMQVEGIDGTEILPPLIIHTLVENGLTHGYRDKESGVFRLKGERRDGKLVLTVFNDSAISDSSPAREGTGLRYVKTRLEETFPGRWAVRSGSVSGGWEAVIELSEAVL